MDQEFHLDKIMPKLDIKLGKFHDKVGELRQEIINQLNQTNDVLDEAYNYNPQHPMTKAETLLAEFKWHAKLSFRHSTIIGSKVEITGMFSKSANKMVSNAVQKFVRTCYEDPKAAYKILNKELKDIQPGHPEVTDTAVRESIYWYTEPFIEIYELESQIGRASTSSCINPGT